MVGDGPVETFAGPVAEIEAMTNQDILDLLGIEMPNQIEPIDGITLLPLAAEELPAAANMPLPLVGRVAAGSPILAQENIEDDYRVDPALFPRKPHYLLRVAGMSMKDAGILDGDLLAVHRTPEALNGQIVVARLDDEVTVKRFRRDGRQVVLLPENDDFEPITVDLECQELVIEGLGVGVIRTLLR